MAKFIVVDDEMFSIDYIDKLEVDVVGVNTNEKKVSVLITLYSKRFFGIQTLACDLQISSWKKNIKLENIKSFVRSAIFQHIRDNKITIFNDIIVKYWIWEKHLIFTSHFMMYIKN